ncbi:PTS sugar transporter subunit IIC [Carnobacterium sp. TMP28]|uniref:PTS sugar transporter subunit IIC n=1 Tax=Carnobacterium sp. TMP28 TaxID=3397060 RepID=UPI0039DF609A
MKRVNLFKVCLFFCSLFTVVQGIPFSVGFGLLGLVGPIHAIKFMEGSAIANFGVAVLVFFVIPFVSAFLVDFILCKVLRVYDKEIFKFFTAE